VHPLSVPFYDGYLPSRELGRGTTGLCDGGLLAQENPIEKTIEGKTILLTGAGGFIGSALAVAIMPRKPSHLILLEHSERNLNEIDPKLAASSPRDLYTSVLVGRERPRNVLDADADLNSILQAVGRARTPEFRESLSGMINPWEKGELPRQSSGC
jgi:Polysaccharide biosynthesis protein